MTAKNLRRRRGVGGAALLLAAFGCGGSDLTAPSPSDLQVTASTSGNSIDLDPDGYTVAVDGGAGKTLPINGSVTFSQLAAGTHRVALSGVAPNCTVSGQNPAQVTVAAGATAHAAFNIACAPVSTPGSVEASATTSGAPADLDQDGYTVEVDGGPVQPLPSNGSVTFPGVTAGTHTVTLSGVATNCTVSGQNPAQVTVAAGATAHAAFQIACAPISGLTGKIAFVHNADLYVMKADGSGVTQLTNTSTAVERQPAWSPDGAKIAFVSNRDSNDEIYVMNADGAGVIRLTNNAAADGAPAWSPDGTKIAFQSNRDGQLEIYVMKANGAGVTRLTENLPNQCTHRTPTCPAARSPAWSPDGVKIAFMHRFGDFGATSLEVMNADGSGVTPVTRGSGGKVAWSVHNQLAFDALSGDNEIYVVNPDGTGLAQLTDNAVTDLYPTWSRDGTRIAFVSNRDGNYEIYAMNANGSGVTRLTYSGGLEPAWGP